MAPKYEGPLSAGECGYVFDKDGGIFAEARGFGKGGDALVQQRQKAIVTVYNIWPKLRKLLQSQAHDRCISRTDSLNVSPGKVPEYKPGEDCGACRSCMARSILKEVAEAIADI